MGSTTISRFLGSFAGFAGALMGTRRIQDARRGIARVSRRIRKYYFLFPLSSLLKMGGQGRASSIVQTLSHGGINTWVRTRRLCQFFVLYFSVGDSR